MDELLRLGKVEDKNLESLIWRLERTAYAVPNAKFFLNRLRHLQYVTAKSRWANLPAATREDLRLWVAFLSQARQGTSINNLIFRRPSHFVWADSCPFGLGGYSASGRAWRLYIPPHLRTPNTNNVLEYMGTIITIWIEAMEGRIPALACILGLSDSSSTVGWMHRTNFDPSQRPVHEACSRHLARILIKYNSILYPQHQRGKHNIITDLLSRWHFLTPAELTIFLRRISSSQLPTNFQISPLPPKIHSWAICTLQRLKDATASQKIPTRSTSEHGNDGSPGWKQWASTETPTYLGLAALRESAWSGALRSAFAEGSTVLPNTKAHWLAAQSARPSQT